MVGLLLFVVELEMRGEIEKSVKIMEVTLNLPDNIYQSFQKLAEKTSWRIDEVITEKIQTDYWTDNSEVQKNISNLSDVEVLELANLKLSKQQAKRMSQLLENQRESRITRSEKIELESLMGFIE